MKVWKISVATLLLAMMLAACGPAESQPPTEDPSPAISEAPTPPSAPTTEVTPSVVPEPTPTPEPVPMPKPTPSETVKPSPEPSEEPEEPAVDTYYALVVDDVTYTVDQPFSHEGLFAEHVLAVLCSRYSLGSMGEVWACYVDGVDIR